MTSQQQQPIRSLLVHLQLTLADGSIAESSRATGKPVLLRLGDGSLSAEFERQLQLIKPGDKRHFTLMADDAYGLPVPDLIQYFSLRDFTETGIPSAGAILLFTAMDGSEMPGVVKDISGDSVTVDFNHPLAGQDITFDIEVLELDPQPEAKSADIAG